VLGQPEDTQAIGDVIDLPTSHQTIGTFSIGHTMVGNTRFGAVDWRPGAQEK
jgi:hypothetical protein